MPQIYQEQKVDKQGKVLNVVRTVSIDQKDADMMNQDTRVTGLRYEAAEPKMDRAELFAQITELGGTMPKNAKTADLEAKLKELQTK